MNEITETARERSNRIRRAANAKALWQLARPARDDNPAWNDNDND